MLINLNRCDEKLKIAIEELKKVLHFETGENGITLRAIESSVNTFEVRGNELLIFYKTFNYIFRGLRLYIQDSENPQIDDCSFDKMGIMLDCSRNGVLNVESVKRMIRLLAVAGYNTLQLYTEDTYEVEGEPYFGYLRGRYTKCELKEIDAYAAEFGIELIPCIQTLAHLNSIFRWQKYQKINDISDILLVGDERTYELIENMFQTLSECFVSRNVNIGMDEASNLGLGKYLNEHGFQNRFEIISEHLKRVKEIADKHGFKIMMWSDMFFALANKGRYYLEKAQNYSEIEKYIPEGISLTYWDYYNLEKKHYDAMLKTHKTLNRRVVFAGGAWTWTGYSPQNGLTIKASDSAIKSCVQNGIKELFFTMWGDNGNDCSPFAVLPSLIVNVEKCYGHKGISFAKKSFETITGIKYDDFMAVDLPSLIGNAKGDITLNNKSKCLLFADYFMNQLELNIEPTEKQMLLTAIKKLRRKEKNPDYGYIFKQLRTLSEAVYIKYDLSNKTRALYKNGDREGIKKLVKECYKPLLIKLNKFYEAHSERWLMDYKPFGEEIHDYRLGGLIQRTKYAIKILNAYADKKTDTIAELDEKILDFYGNGENAEKRINVFNYFVWNTTTNIM